MQSSMSRPDPSELTACEIALEEWQENIRKWESIAGDCFNPSMKIHYRRCESHFMCRMWMTAVTVPFLQHNAQYQAGVTVTPNNRRGPDDMEIDALMKKARGHKGKVKSKNDGQKTTCFVCGRVGHMAKDCWFKETSESSVEQCERNHDSDRVDDDSTSQSNLENHAGRHSGPSRPQG